ncbi:MAG TPA: lmo0937 family membrane protein, partial [Candidatus Angelobacter sp.]|nr:lmo0937 family membrane protein [Candidatus Angelobacter sp.]
MLWTIFAILIILWLLGWGFHVAGGLIHLLLVIALIVAVI